MSIIDSLKWRYATKKFDTDKKVSDADIAKLKEAVQLTPSSYGFQLYKVLVVTDKKQKISFTKSLIINPKFVIAPTYLYFAVIRM